MNLMLLATSLKLIRLARKMEFNAQHHGNVN
jgi:hypothetical protein